MSTLKETLRHDLTESIRARDALVSGTLRMALAAVTNEEVAGKVHRELDDAQVLKVIAKEAKKRKEAVAAYTSAHRPELAEREEAELAVLERYLPAALTDDEVKVLVAQAISQTGANSIGQLGAVMKAVQPLVAGKADGARVAAAVRAALTS
jgi:uncharacterized protein YqeY